MMLFVWCMVVWSEETGKGQGEKGGGCTHVLRVIFVRLLTTRSGEDRALLLHERFPIVNRFSLGCQM